tara:strand:- start:593785 stop:594198 length:414 start_codon:yes stop_codon:yes gene_type:complete
MRKAKILSLMLGGLFILGGCSTEFSDTRQSYHGYSYNEQSSTPSVSVNTQRDVEVFSIKPNEPTYDKRELAIDHSVVQNGAVTIYNVEERQPHRAVKIDNDVEVQNNGKWRSMSSKWNGRLDIGEVRYNNENRTFNE